MKSNVGVEWFLGLGQGAKNADWLRRRVQEGVIVHEAPDYLQAGSPNEVEELGVGWVKQAIGLRLSDYDLFAESQAAPSVVAALSRGDIVMPRRLVLVQPLGCNRDALGKNPRDRRRELLRRSRLFWSHPNQSLAVRGNFWTAVTIIAQSLRHVLRLKQAYTIGASQDIRGKLISLAETLPVSIYASDQDSLFPYHEVAATFAGTKVNVIRLGGTHLNRATPGGLDQLRELVDKD